MKMNEQLSDLVGAIYHSDLYDSFYYKDPQREVNAWDQLSHALEKIDKKHGFKKDFDEYEEFENLTLNYGSERAETGFRIGFAVALQLLIALHNVKLDLNYLK